MIQSHNTQEAYMKTGIIYFALTITLIFLCTYIVSAQTNYQAHLSGSNEVHLPPTIASGTIEAVLTDTTLVLSGTFSNLTSPVAVDIGGGAHIHLGYAGEDGPVVFPLNVDLDADLMGGTFAAEDNTFELDSDQVEALNDRRYYVNIHTEMFPAGEIRGQLVPAADEVLRVNLTGNNETPPIHTAAYGSLVGELNDNELTLSGSFSNLSSPLAVDIGGGAHIHEGLAGQAGGVEIALDVTSSDDLLSGVFEAANNTYTLTEAQLEMLQNRELYVNVHSENFQPGEIRGQILSQVDAVFQANLSGATETPPVNTDATGAVIAELTDNELIVTGSFAGLSSPLAVAVGGGAHIHIGYAGESGGVVIPLVVTPGDTDMSGTFEADENTFELDEEDIENLTARRHYVNIHSENYQPGEIRGQLLGEARSYFYANLDGLNEIINGSPVITEAAGGITVERTGDRIILSGSFDGLSSDLAVDIGGGAHLHEGGPSETGGVVIPLSVTTGEDMQSGIFDAADNMYTMEEETEMLLIGGNLYANIHSENYQPGEIRGQLLPDPHFFTTESGITVPEDGSLITLEGDPDAEITVTWSEAADPTDNEVVYVWQAAVDEAFETLIVNINAGTEPMVNFTVIEVDSILADAGVEDGDTVTVYHRTISGNGSLNRAGPVASVDFIRGTITSVDDDPHTLPDKLALHQNYPNPFNPTTNIIFDLPERTTVSLKIYDLLGREVATLIDNEELRAGSFNVEFDAGRLSSGQYFYTLFTETTQITNKILLIK